MTISVQAVSKSFRTQNRETSALRRIDLEIRSGEFVVFLGPSGCGKSTLLNMIAGIVPLSTGSIRQDERAIEGINTHVGYLTQADSLLPWRNTQDNVILPLVLRGMSARDARPRAMDALGRVGLSGFAQAFPAELSGGMRKRAALAQILAYDPDVLLMDEPFGALDAQLKLVMQQILLDMWTATSKTVVFVTHDVGEAITLADRVVVFSERPGRIKHIETIAIDRPRHAARVRFHPQFNEIYERLWSLLAPDLEGGLLAMKPADTPLETHTREISEIGA